MNAQLRDILHTSLAGSTRAVYHVGVKHFISFCSKRHICPFPARKQTLVYFAVSLSRSLAPSTISVYINAVGAIHRQHGLADPTHHNKQLNLVLRGIRRMQPVHCRRHRKPITATLLVHLLTHLKNTKYIPRQDRRMLQAAFTLAFTGFLRIGELTAPSSKQFDPRYHSTISSIEWHKKHFNFHLPRTKTDQLQLGQTVFIPKSSNQFCPYASMSSYIRHQRCHQVNHAQPLFSFADGKPLSRQSFLKYLRQLLQDTGHNPANYNTHSFRIGAATTAAAIGIPTHSIKRLGRWRSKAYSTYTRSHYRSTKKAAKTLTSLLAPSSVHR